MGQLPDNSIPQNRAAQTQKGGNIMTGKSVCELCKRVGANGAQWLVKTADGKTVKVHKPCGQTLVESAPVAAGAKLVPSPELKAQWKAKRAERQVRDFWASKFPKLLEIKNDLEAKEKAMT